VLDKGSVILQFNTKASVGQEKFKAAEFVQSLVNDRESHAEVRVFDEGGHGAGTFLAEFGVDSVLRSPSRTEPSSPPALYRLSDSSGHATFEHVEPAALSTLSSLDAFLLDHSCSPHPAIYAWIGKSASLTERRLVVQYAQTYAHKRQSEAEYFNASISLIKMNEGHESDAFIHAFDS